MKKSNRFKNIPFSKSLPFWSWNDKLDDEKLSEQIEWMKNCGIGGFFMHARAGLKTEYLSKEWFDRINFCAEKAAENGMQAWAYDENGWPSGFVGGKLLTGDNLENFLEISYGAADNDALVSYDISGDKLVRLKKGENSENCLNVFKRTAVSSVDILDEKVVKRFINETHERYKKELGKNFSLLSGFFTDEPQFCSRALLYPHVIEREFKKEYGENVLDGLGLLFIKKQGYELFRYRYYRLCQKLMLNSFAKQIYEWCDKNGVKLTGHYIEERSLFMQMLCCAGIMPFYEYEHIPGIDWLCKRYLSVVLARQLGSVCRQLGKKEALTETFAMTGWDATPKELKSIAEFQYLYGANKTCQHLLPYSEYGERKNDHPTHFTPLNPWVKEAFGKFNEYFNKLGGIMQAGKEYVNVAVLQTVRSAYLNYEFGDHNSVKELDDSFIGVSEYLAKQGIGFHYLDETLLEKHGFVNGRKIGCGKCEYEYLVVPKCYTIDKTTEKLLKEFINNGGKILFTSNIPYLVEALPTDLSYLKSNTTFEEIRAAQPYSFNCLSDKVYPVYYGFDGFDMLMVLNIDNDVTAEGSFKVSGKVSEYDLLTDTEKPATNNFALEPLQSKIFIIDKKASAQACVENKKTTVVFPYNNLHIADCDDNCLLLDYARYSLDGVKYSEPTAVIGIFDEMLKKQYDGDLYLSFEFNVKDIPSRAKVLSEYYDNATLTVNGNKIGFGDEYYVEKKMRLADISQFIKLGKNVIDVKLRFYENEKVYYALFGEGITESLRNCLVYDTYLESLRIFGNFGVYSDDGFIYGKEKDVIIAQNFYIGAKKAVINEMTKDGYPFFAGRIKFREYIRLYDTNVMLKFMGKIHFANVYVNGMKAGELMFDDAIDISKCAVVGDNEVEIEIFTGLRNFYGPHHHAVHDEIGGVTPNTFLMANTWKNDTSIYERKSYSLVRTGIFKPIIKEWYHL